MEVAVSAMRGPGESCLLAERPLYSVFVGGQLPLGRWTTTVCYATPPLQAAGRRLGKGLRLLYA